MVKPEYVGCSPSSRSGWWADVGRAHSLGAPIVAQGFDDAKAATATCIEKPTVAKDAAEAVEVNSNP